MDSVLGQLKVLITGEISGLTGALNQARSAISSFSSTAAGAFAGILGFSGLSGLINMVENVGRSVLQQSASFETYTTSISDMLSAVSDLGDNTANTMSEAGSKTSLSALMIEDALINHKERVIEIQDSIADAMKGQNIIDAQQRMADQVDQINGDMLTRKQDRAKNNANNLRDMEQSHNDDMSDKEEKFQDELSKTHSTVAKRRLQKKHDEEMKQDDDAFQKKLARKKAQQDRDEAEAASQDKRDKDLKIARLKDKFADETKVLDDQNAQKLAKYKQNLSDEERAFEIHMQNLKRAQSSAGVADTGVTPLGKESAFSDSKSTMSDMLNIMQEMGRSSPFKSDDITAVTNKMVLMDMNAKKLLPTIGNLGASAHASLGETFQAVLMGATGRLKVLERGFGLTEQELIKVGAIDPFTKKVTSMESFLTGIQKITAEKFGDSMAHQADTLSGKWTILQNKFGDLAQSFKDTKAFGELKKILDELGKWVDSHHSEIEKFITGFAKGLIELVKAVAPLAKSIGEWTVKHGDLMGKIAAGIIVIGGLSTVFAMLIPIITVIHALIPVVGLVIAALTTPIGLVIGALLLIGIGMRVWQDHSKEIVKTVSGYWDTFVVNIKFIGTQIGNIWTGVIEGIKTSFKTGFDWIGKQLDGFVKPFEKFGNEAKKMLDKINPFHHESPSLVENVQEGVRQIEAAYSKLGNVKVQVPQIGGSRLTTAPSNHQTYHYNTPTVNQTNTFNVKGEANASNLAAYLGFQLEHHGMF